jgi:hypothetical protein
MIADEVKIPVKEIPKTNHKSLGNSTKPAKTKGVLGNKTIPLSAEARKYKMSN